ncbi:MAG: hypothetical protein IPK26_06870 [Planctomycetes bacterium]|nr:hypothetical protein [Planctomycetota bacterium]
MSDDGAVLASWWREHVSTGGLPAAATVVQQRLVRAVGRAELPSGPVFVKVMAFPRAKDRLRYLFRALPGAHEATMLAAVAAAGIPCPRVVAVETLRRRLLPHRSMLVLRALPVAPTTRTWTEQLAAEARIGVALLAAGIVHGDLNLGNFVTLPGGELAVLDLQSARRGGGGCRARMDIAARLLGEHVVAGHLTAAAGVPVLRAVGLLTSDVEAAAVLELAALRHRLWLRGRIRRCLQQSTEYSRAIRWNGVEHRQRGPLPAGQWHCGPRAFLRRAWLGQRALQVLEGRSPRLPAIFCGWPWLPSRSAVYVPDSLRGVPVQAELQVLSEGFERHRQWLDRRWHGTLPLQTAGRK